MMNGRQLRWIAMHFIPLSAVAIVTHAVSQVAPLNAAAGFALVALIASVAIGQSFLISNTRVTVARWRWQTAFATGISMAVGLVVISTIDLAGYDAAATVIGMTSVGLVLATIQSTMLVERRLQWIAAASTSWLIAAIVFRAIIESLAAFSIGGAPVWGLAYNGGHNELLWMSTGLAFYGLGTVSFTSISTRKAPPTGMAPFAKSGTLR